MNNSIKSKLKYIWILPIAALILSSIPKIFTMEFMVNGMEATGMENVETTLVLLGLVELLCPVVFLIPKTRKVGFLLSTAFIGGIIATEWMEPASTPVTGIVLQILLWVGMYFENPALFKK